MISPIFAVQRTIRWLRDNSPIRWLRDNGVGVGKGIHALSQYKALMYDFVKFYILAALHPCVQDSIIILMKSISNLSMLLVILAFTAPACDL